MLFNYGIYVGMKENSSTISQLEFSVLSKIPKS